MNNRLYAAGMALAALFLAATTAEAGKNRKKGFCAKCQIKPAPAVQPVATPITPKVTATKIASLVDMKNKDLFEIKRRDLSVCADIQNSHNTFPIIVELASGNTKPLSALKLETRVTKDQGYRCKLALAYGDKQESYADLDGNSCYTNIANVDLSDISNVDESDTVLTTDVGALFNAGIIEHDSAAEGCMKQIIAAGCMNQIMHIVNTILQDNGYTHLKLVLDEERVVQVK